MYERENILRIFKETKEAVAKGDAARIKALSDQTTNSASLTQDPDNIAAAVVVYSLSKILEREDYRKLPGWDKFYSIYVDSIDKIIGAIEKNDDVSYRKNIEAVRTAIGKVSGKLGSYIQDVFRHASINKASRLYEHGVSMERTANLLGVTLYELANYAGEKQGEEPIESRTIGVKERIKIAEDIFS